MGRMKDTLGIPTGFGRELDDPVELYHLFTVDEDGRRTAPHHADVPELWAVVVIRGPRRGTHRVVWARPTMRSVGAALGAAGLLTDARLLGQLATLPYHVDRRPYPDNPPPAWLEQALLDALA